VERDVLKLQVGPRAPWLSFARARRAAGPGTAAKPGPAASPTPRWQCGCQRRLVEHPTASPQQRAWAGAPDSRRPRGNPTQSNVQGDAPARGAGAGGGRGHLPRGAQGGAEAGPGGAARRGGGAQVGTFSPPTGGAVNPWGPFLSGLPRLRLACRDRNAENGSALGCGQLPARRGPGRQPPPEARRGPWGTHARPPSRPPPPGLPARPPGPTRPPARPTLSASPPPAGTRCARS
jgi:hypothetical protein